MASRLCPTCKQIVPSRDYAAHREAHRNATKPNPHHAPASRRARRRALERGGYRCVVCGRSQKQLRELGVGLDAHHINGDPLDNSDGNLELRCGDHHQRGGHQPY